MERPAAAGPSAPALRWPRQLFWKILAACWCTSIGTGLGIHLFARLWPGLVDLPPAPPRLSQSLGMPLLAGPCPPEGDRVDIAALLDRVAQDARFEAQASGHRLRWSPPNVPCWRPAQSELLRRTFDNVLRNALKHGPPDQPVEITLPVGAPTRSSPVLDAPHEKRQAMVRQDALNPS